MFRFPPRRVLVPVDLSEPSENAFRAARLVAEKFGARLEAAYCDAPLPPEIAAYDAQTRDSARRRTEAELRRRFAGAAVLHVARGDPARVILRLARERRPDLIVMGTHGRRGLVRFVLGSVAETVLRYSPAPVLIVRKSFRAPRRVLAPVREDDDAQRGLVAAGLVARAFSARLDALHVVTDPLFGPRPERLLRERLARLPKDVLRDCSPTCEARLGDPLEHILRATHGRDLLVLVARPKSILGDLVLGTTAERLARYSPIPVLAIPGPRRRGITLLAA